MRDESGTADFVQQLTVAQDLCQDDDIRRVLGSPELHQDRVDRGVCGLVEILLVDPLDAFADHVGWRDQHGAEHALLGFQAVRQCPVNIRYGYL